MTVERIHLVLEPRLMKAFRAMAEKNHRSVSGQFAFILEGEIHRQRQPNVPEIPLRYLPTDEDGGGKNDSHLSN